MDEAILQCIRALNSARSLLRDGSDRKAGFQIGDGLCDAGLGLFCSGAGAIAS